MPDDKTQTLEGGGSFEERVLAQLAAIDARLNIMEQRFDERLSALEAQAEERAKETRPIWNQLLAEVAALNHQSKETNVRLAEMNERFGAIAEDQLTMRGKQKYFE